MKKIDGGTCRRILTASFCIAAIAVNLVQYLSPGGDPELTVSRFSDAAPLGSAVQEEAAEKAPEPLSAAHDDRIDLNHASAEELQSLKGIGPAKAQAIIEYRERYGGFTCIEEITEVKGIGEKTFEKLKEDICVTDLAP